MSKRAHKSQGRPARTNRQRVDCRKLPGARRDTRRETAALSDVRFSRGELDPASLQPRIREAQSTLVTINATDSASVPQSESLVRFLSSLPGCGIRVRFVRRTLLIRENAENSERAPIPSRGYGARCWLQ